MEENEAVVANTPEAKRRLIRIGLFIVSLMVLSGLSFAAYWFWQSRTPSGLPSSVVHRAGFAVYYPEPLPNGYILAQNITHLDSGVLTYTVENRDRIITINEQPAPKNGPDFQAVQTLNTSFKPIDLPSGKALVGIDTPTSKPIIIISTNTTLMVINGSKSVPQDVMVTLAKSMTSLAL